MLSLKGGMTMLNQSLRRALIAPDLEMRVHALLEELWNADDFMLRHHFRILFLGVKPSCADFLINTAIALQTTKTPEE
jgi:hypothetical protein